jgi:non-specific serine/threonine protein kinase/serine/threonine-protein kinase
METKRRLFGPEHPLTLKTMHMLAIVYDAQCKHAQAEALDRQALEIRRRVLGSEHPDTVNSMDALGEEYIAEGKYAQGEKILRI